MPEKLLLTAQNTNYLHGADLTIMLRGGKTLGEFREQFKMEVSLFKGESITVKGINSYLFKKSKQHKDYFLQFERQKLIFNDSFFQPATPSTEITAQDESKSDEIKTKLT